MACFASLIAPFGGFFASGVKRAFHIKDFGQSIPGHGGMTDRMDCQFLMGLFASIYYTSFIKVNWNSFYLGLDLKVMYVHDYVWMKLGFSLCVCVPE